jgi:hypothetical protein
MRFDEFNEPKVGDILEVEIGDEIVETVIVGITESGDYLCETDNETGMSLLESRSDWDSNMPGYKGDYGGAENWGRRSREDDEHHEIDRQREQQLAQYNQTGNFWLKYKDSGKHISDKPYVGKAAANAAALLMIRSNPEVKGNLLITAYGPDEVREAHGNSKIYDKCWTGYKKVPGKKRGEKGSCEKIGEGLTEMDKSAPQPGRDGKVSHSTYGSRDKKGSDYFKGKEAPGKPVTAKQMSKDALDILKKQGVAEGMAGMDDAEPYTIGGAVDKQYVYTVMRDGKSMGIYHSLDDAKSIVANNKRTNKYSEFKIQRKPRSKMAGPVGQLPEQSVAEGYTVTRGIDRERYQERHGLEGPFSTKSGKVVYYDKVEGKYYDPDTDMYIEYSDWQAMNEAEYQGRKVPLGKPMQGDVAKSKVYVKNPQGNVVKVNFGDKNMRIKKSNPGRRKNFRARHNCENPGPRHKARYWSCRAW